MGCKMMQKYPLSGTFIDEITYDIPFSNWTKVLISPFFKGKNIDSNYFTPRRTADEWCDIFEKCGKNVDYCAFQDGTVLLEEYKIIFQ